MIAAPLKNAQTLFLAEENHAKTGSACLAVVEAGNLAALAQAFLDAGFHLEDVSGLDAAEGAVSVYHFDHFDEPCRTTVLVVAPHDNAVFPSIAPVYEGAEWHERETRDFFGFTYENNPNLIPLLLPDDMVDVHPLTKAEGARASLATLFAAEGRERTVVSKADGFTLLDVLVEEETAPKTPMGPSGPAIPGEPVGPAGPSGPVTPLSPAKHAGPSGPSIPGEPAGPAGPSKPKEARTEMTVVAEPAEPALEKPEANPEPLAGTKTEDETAGAPAKADFKPGGKGKAAPPKKGIKVSVKKGAGNA